VGVRKAVKGVAEFLMETVGEVVAEVLLGVLACALVLGLGLGLYLSWSFSPRSTVVGLGVLSLLFAHGGWRTYRDTAEGRRRRGVAAMTTAFFTLTATTAVFLLFYGTGCDCL